MKVLIITYYWPPAGGSGVQRWLNFVKYLHNFGIEPVVYTVKNAKYPIKDISLGATVPKNCTILKHAIVEPNTILSFFKNNTEQSAGFLQSNPSFFSKVLQYIRANYFIPDARKFWIKPSVKYLKKYLAENKIDVVITTGPPHSLHLIALQLKKDIGIRWIADFRDPWTSIDYFHQLPLTKASKKKHFSLEKKVLEQANAVVVVGKTMQQQYMPFNKHTFVITNGFDGLERLSTVALDTKFSITHIGMMNADRNPKKLWKVLSELCLENPTFKKDVTIQLIGKIAVEVEEELLQYKLPFTKVAYLPHQEVIDYQQQTQVLLLPVNNVPNAKGIITGKIFEYLQAKRPILAIGPEDGDLATILTETQSGIIVDFNEETKLKLAIKKMYTDYKMNNLYINSKNITQYHRKNLTQKLATIIKQVALT